MKLILNEEDLNIHNQLWHNENYLPEVCHRCQFRAQNLQVFRFRHTKVIITVVSVYKDNLGEIWSKHTLFDYGPSQEHFEKKKSKRCIFKNFYEIPIFRKILGEE